MIKANELRIGNLVYRVHAPYGNERSRWFEQIKDGASIDNQRLLSSHIEPIPLSPEILEQCGFKWDNNCFDNNTYFITEDKDNKEFDVHEHDRNAYITSVKYLHQLQNLFFALTGEELKINQVVK